MHCHHAERQGAESLSLVIWRTGSDTDCHPDAYGNSDAACADSYSDANSDCDTYGNSDSNRDSDESIANVDAYSNRHANGYSNAADSHPYGNRYPDSYAYANCGTVTEWRLCDGESGSYARSNRSG